MLKYIVIEDSNGNETIHLWNKNYEMTHYDMYNAISNIKSDYENRGNGKQFLRTSKVVGAGFYDGVNCHGESISLDVKSRGGGDTILIPSGKPKEVIEKPLKPTRNSPCKCGSGKKAKKCCWYK